MSLEQTIHTGDSSRDEEQLERWRDEVRSQGLEPEVEPLPGGGFQCRAIAPPAEQNELPNFDVGTDEWDDPTVIHDGLSAVPLGGRVGSDAPAEATPSDSDDLGFRHQAVTPRVQDAVSPDLWALAGTGGAADTQGVPETQPPPDGSLSGHGWPTEMDEGERQRGGRRLVHLQKVYAWLVGAALIGVMTGWATVATGPSADTPVLVSLLLGHRLGLGIALAGLLAAVLLVGAISHIRYINAVGLVGLAALSGSLASAMTLVVLGGAGPGLASAYAVRDASLLTILVFVGTAAYAFAVPKRFSLVGAFLSMASSAAVGAILITVVLGADALSLLTASVATVASMGLLLLSTRLILRNRLVRNPVQDALVIPVEINRLLSVPWERRARSGFGED